MPSGGTAQSEYDAAIVELQASVDMARTRLQSSADKITEYQEKIAKGEQCGAALAEEQANYSSLAAKLQSELNAQAIKSVEAKQKYEEALLNRDYAGSVYEIDTADVDSAVEEAEIVLTAYGDKTYEGKVKSVDTSSSSGMPTVSYDVAVLFTGDVSDVHQDMTGSVTFIASKAEDVCCVSRKAVVLEDGRSYLKVKKEDGTIEKREVVTGISDSVNIEIKEGGRKETW